MNKILVVLIFVAVLIMVVSTQPIYQSHPLSEISPIDVDLDMGSNNIVGVNRITGVEGAIIGDPNTPFENIMAYTLTAGEICLSGVCKMSWPTDGTGGTPTLSEVLTQGESAGGNSITNVGSLQANEICLSGDCYSSWADAIEANINSISGVPPETKIVFVTSTIYRPGIDFSGVAEADSLCMARRDAACNDNPSSPLCGKTFRAWLSTETVPAPSHINCAGFKSYVRPDGQIVAEDCSALLNAYYVDLQNPINVDEFITEYSSSFTVWTGTRFDGQPYFYGGQVRTCEDWTSSSASGGYGYTSSVDQGWTAYNQASCDGAKRLYCFEI